MHFLDAHPVYSQPRRLRRPLAAGKEGGLRDGKV
jgi:hypothetical protein